MSAPALSIVATVYNDAALVPRLVEELARQAQSLNVNCEIILVDDRSDDDSPERIRQACERSPAVRGLRLARNYGQQIAISAGVRYAKGEYVLVMDGDLENPTAAIPALYRKAKEGFDIVYAVARERQTFGRRITSELFWFAIERLLRIDIVKNQLLMRVMSRRVVDRFDSYDEITRSVAGITRDIGLRTAQIEVQPGRRPSGASHYTFLTRLNMFIDIALNLSLKPLNFVLFAGFFAFLFSAVGSLYYLYMYLTAGSISGYTSTILSIFLFGGIITFTLGVMARYLSLIYLEVRRRPLFAVDAKYNL